MLPGKRYKPEDIVRIAWARKWVIVVPFLIAALATAVFLRRLPDQYRSETTILVVPQRVSDSIVQAQSGRLQERLQAIQQQILSRTRLERIITDFDLYPEERASGVMQDVVDNMRDEDVFVDIVRGDAFKVSYISHDPALAQRVTERLASYFIDENLRDREIQAEATSQFLDTELQNARQTLQEQEKRLEDFRLRYGGELPTQAGSNLQAVQNLQQQVQSLQESISRDRDRRLVLERQLTEAEASVAPVSSSSDGTEESRVTLPAGAGEAERKLAQARQEFEVMQMRLKPEHPDIARAKRVIADLERKAEAERTEAADEAARVAAGGKGAVRLSLSAPARRIADLREEIQNIDRDVRAKEQQIGEARRSSGIYQSRLEAMPSRESELTELMRDYETTNSLYQNMLAKKQSANVVANLERREIGEQFKVLDPARRPERPFSPNRPFYAAVGAAAGLGLGLGLVALLEFRDRSFRSETDVLTALQLPVLVSIPRMRGSVERGQRWRRRLISATALTALLAVAGFAIFRFLG